LEPAYELIFGVRDGCVHHYKIDADSNLEALGLLL
jgi:hypothetical protein